MAAAAAGGVEYPPPVLCIRLVRGQRLGGDAVRRGEPPEADPRGDGKQDDDADQDQGQAHGTPAAWAPNAPSTRPPGRSILQPEGLVAVAAGIAEPADGRAELVLALAGLGGHVRGLLPE